MPVIGRPSETPATPLFSFGWWLGSFANNLNDLGNRIEDVFIIGTWLASPFKTMAWILHIAENQVYRADDFLINVWTWVNGLIEGQTFLDLLYWASGHFWAIRHQPVTWVKAQLGQIGYWFGWLMFDPKSFISHFLRELVWFGGLLIDNPTGFVSHFIRSIVWHVGLFLDNPVSFINHFIRSISWHIGLLIDNPQAFVRHFLIALQPLLDWFIFNPRDFIIQQVKLYNPELAQFIDNPMNWLRHKLLWLLKFDWSFFDDPIVYLFRKMIERIETLLEPHLEKIKELVINILLRYI